jgi:hypothetical protein
LTPVGSILIGTPDYLAPEQALDFHGADIRADIYSLGCTFYYLLTGQPPFPGGMLAQKLLRHQQEEPAPLAQVRSDVPREVETVLRRMLAKRPADRYQTPAEVAEAIAVFAQSAALTAPAALIAKDGIALPDTMATQRLRSPGSPLRNRRWVAAGLGVFLVALLGVGLALGLRGKISPSGPTNPLDGPSAARSPLDALKVIPPPAGVELDGQAPPLVAVLGTPGRDRDGGTNLAFSADATLVGCRSEPLIFRIWSTTTGREWTAVKGDERAVRDMALAPTGRLLASAGGMDRTVGVRLWDLSSDGNARERSPLKETGMCLAFAADGSLLAIGRKGGGVNLWSAATNKVTPLAGDEQPARQLAMVAFAPDGQVLAELSGGILALRNVPLGTIRSTLKAEEGRFAAVVFAPNGRTVATADSGGQIHLWDANTGTKRLSVAKVPGRVTALAYSPNGETLAVAESDGRVSLWHADTGGQR